MIRTNHVLNGSFELDLAGWSAGGAGTVVDRSLSTAQVGTWSGIVAWPSSAAVLSASARYTVSGLTAGQTYRFAAWVYVPGMPSLATSPKLFVSGAGQSPAATSVFAWQLLQVTFTAAAATATVGLANGAAYSAAGLSCYLDAAMLVLDDGPVSSTWDGSTPRSSSHVSWWHGTPDASLSYRADKAVLTRNGAVAVELDVLDWSDEWAYSGAVLPILGSPRAVDIPASTLHHYGPRKIMATCYMPDESTSWAQLATLLDAGLGKTTLRSPDPGLNAPAVRIVRARRRPGPIPRRHWPVDLELVEVAS